MTKCDSPPDNWSAVHIKTGVISLKSWKPWTNASSCEISVIKLHVVVDQVVQARKK